MVRTTGILANDLLNGTFWKVVVPVKRPASTLEPSGKVACPFSITR